MRRLKIYKNKVKAGILEEIIHGVEYIFRYSEDYQSTEISLTMPVENKVFEFKKFPAVFDGLLPEGERLENLTKNFKIDRNNFISQLAAIGKILKGEIELEEME